LSKFGGDQEKSIPRIADVFLTRETIWSTEILLPPLPAAKAFD
jgi:hypothetical protein